MTLNPFAWECATERVVRAEDTPRGGNFQCLECEGALILRRGEVRMAHFAHHHEDGERKCGGGASESWQHLQAKELIRDFLPQWRFIACCGACRQEEEPQSFDGYTVVLEQRCDKYRPDATIWRDGDRVATVEVYHTHRTGEEKAAHFVAINLPMMEVVATDVIDQHASGSHLLRYSGAKCGKCQELEAYRAVRSCCVRCNQWVAKELVVGGRCPACHFQTHHTLCHRCKDWQPNGECLYDRCLACRQRHPNDSFCTRCLEWKVGDPCVGELCARCRKRPCHACGKWSLRDTLIRIDPPSGHKYPDAFLCMACAVKCDVCLEWIPRHPFKRLCEECFDVRQKWRSSCEIALRDENSVQLRKLIDTAPLTEPLVYREYLESSLVKIREKELADRLEREALHARTVLRQWRGECATALLNPRREVLQTLIASRPRGEPVDVLETALQNAQRIEANVRAKFARLRDTGLVVEKPVNLKRKTPVLIPETQHNGNAKRVCINK